MTLAISDIKFMNLKSTLETVNLINNKFKPLTKRIKSIAGRSNGHIVSLRRSNFCRRLYRFIDFKRTIFAKEYGLILRKQYDPQRSAPIGLVCFPTGFFTNILLPSKTLEGTVIQNYTDVPRNFGDSSKLRYIPSGSLIHNISLRPKGIGQLTRSAGCSTILIRKEYDHCLLKLKSGEIRYFDSAITASLGSVGGEDHFLKPYVKAGTIRRLGKRPRSRPSAMNPVDHPMGGRTKGGCQPMTAKGFITLNRSTKKTLSYFYTLYQKTIKI